ncbi:MAG: succinyl-diaminopimelate desuccinylase [Alphaproteobacteria bacterium]
MNHDPLPLAQSLIQVASVTPDQGDGLDVIASWLEPLGFEVRRMPFGEGSARVDNLYARRGSGDGLRLCFLGHSDVVPPGDEAAWRTPPFAATVRDGVLTGRGAVDMKGGIAAFCAALARCSETGSTDGGTGIGRVSLLITGDEEGVARFGTRAVIEALVGEGEEWDACLVGEPTSVARLGDTIKTGRRGSLTARITVHGKQGHTAYPQLADNPIHKLLGALHEITATPLDEGTEHFQPSNAQVSCISASNTASNVIPASVSATLNVRYNDLHSAASLEEWLREILARHADKFSAEIHSSGDAFRSGSGRLTAVVCETLSELTGQVPEISTGGGTSDARFMWRYAEVVEFGLVGKTMHSVDESVLVEELRTLSTFYEQILRRFFS